MSNRVLAVGDSFIPGYREICLPQIVITILFFKDVTYICGTGRQRAGLSNKARLFCCFCITSL